VALNAPARLPAGGGAFTVVTEEVQRLGTLGQNLYRAIVDRFSATPDAEEAMVRSTAAVQEPRPRTRRTRLRETADVVTLSPTYSFHLDLDAAAVGWRAWRRT
jgi:hypothetical protein